MNRAWKKRNGAKTRLAARRAKLIVNGINDSFSTDQVVDDFVAMGFQSITPEQARQWAQTHVRVNDDSLRTALFTIYVEAYALGEDIGLSAIGKARISKAPTLRQLQRATNINWDTWKPGNKPAALLVRKPRGLSTLLDRRGITIQGINRTTLDRVGTLLARALERGWTPQEIKEQIADAIDDDTDRALTIAQTEMSRAVTTASRELYEESGVELVEWLVADPCDLCEENADVSPIRIGETFPSGDTEPPAHPNCVCDLAPYVTDTRNMGEDALSLLLGEDEDD
jgi:hypothetical protein